MNEYLNNAGSAARENWNSVKEKMSIKTMPTINVKPAEMEFRKLVMKMTKKGDADVEMLEKKLKSRNSGQRKQTEFEIMKSRLKHVQFSDDEKGFLSTEQMEMVSEKIRQARNELAEIQRDAKSNGCLLADKIENFANWKEEVEHLQKVGLEIDMDSLLQARKRTIIKDLFYDPEEAERRRRAMEEARRLKELREQELERQKQLEMEERQRRITEEMEKVRKEREEAKRKLREEEEEKRRLAAEEDKKLREYAEEKRRLLQLERQQSGSQDESKNRRLEMMRKFSSADKSPTDDSKVDALKSRRSSVGKLDISFQQDSASKKPLSVGKLESPFQPTESTFKKPRSRRASRVGKLNLNSQFEADEKVPWSRNTSRQGSRKSSRRGSLSGPSGTNLSDANFAQEIGDALAGLQDLADKASKYDEE